tara:strand:- start:4323 stop:4511 length:189 start_codon:yes stop_codon:yes gene_type:complete
MHKRDTSEVIIFVGVDMTLSPIKRGFLRQDFASLSILRKSNYGANLYMFFEKDRCSSFSFYL